MKIPFEILKISRANVIKTIEKLTLEQIHTIPHGFKNHIAWNVAHLVVTQQLLNYKLSGLNCLCSNDLIETYKKGTFPTKKFSKEEFDTIKNLFIGFPKTLQKDYETGVFKTFNHYQTSTGFVLDSIETAITYNNYHEGIHSGIIMAIKKIL